MRLVVTKNDYFAAALDVLATNGHAALKIGSLCRAIGVTTGSFYHYFGGWDGFVRELLAHWEQEKTQRIFQIAGAEPDPMARVRKIKKLALTLPHEAETAIRAWSHINPLVDEVQRRVDHERLDAVRSVIARRRPRPPPGRAAGGHGRFIARRAAAVALAGRRQRELARLLEAVRGRSSSPTWPPPPADRL